MNTPYALFIGIDRSDKHLDFTVLDGAGNVMERGKVSTDPAALHPWMETWQERVAVGARVVVAFEEPAPNLLVFFSQFEGVVGIYPLNPAAVRPGKTGGYAAFASHVSSIPGYQRDSVERQSSFKTRVRICSKR